MIAKALRHVACGVAALTALLLATGAHADEPKGEMNLILPDFHTVQFLGVSGCQNAGK